MQNLRFFQFGTLCAVAVHDERPGTLAILEAVRRDAEAVRRLLDFYDPDSELGRLNAGHVPGKPYPVSGELFAILWDMLRFSKMSNGCFDPTVAPLVRLWDFTAGKPRPLQSQAVREAVAHCGFSKVRLDRVAQTVTFEAAGMALDAGGAGKGYAADRAVRLLRNAGVRTASVDYGGNLFLLGRCEGRPWRIGVQTPWRPRGESLGTLDLCGCAVSTSGVYERCFQSGGRVYHHLLDPRSGRPAQNGLAAVTVTCQSALWADMLSTACFVAGPGALPGVAAALPASQKAGWLAVDEDGGVQTCQKLAPHFEAYEKDRKVS